MAATGIRTGEVIALDITSLDQAGQTLTVRGKYDKIRLLPLDPSVVEALTDYLEQRDELLPAAACPALLISAKGTRLRPSNVHPTFRGLADQVGLKPASSACRPRLHDFRHTFAVSTMLEAYRSGADAAGVLPILLGDVPSSGVVLGLAADVVSHRAMVSENCLGISREDTTHDGS